MISVGADTGLLGGGYRFEVAYLLFLMYLFLFWVLHVAFSFIVLDTWDGVIAARRR